MKSLAIALSLLLVLVGCERTQRSRGDQTQSAGATTGTLESWFDTNPLVDDPEWETVVITMEWRQTAPRTLDLIARYGTGEKAATGSFFDRGDGTLKMHGTFSYWDKSGKRICEERWIDGMKQQ